MSEGTVKAVVVTTTEIPTGDAPTATTPKQNRQQPVVQTSTNLETSCKAVASLVCAIIGIVIFGVVLGPIAICLGVAAKNEIKERPDQVGGECQANSGIVIGIIDTILSILVIVAAVSEESG